MRKSSGTRAPRQSPEDNKGTAAQKLERELALLRSQLQSLTANDSEHVEELQTANDEVRSANEELRNANEALDAAKENLKSANARLLAQNKQLASANSDLINILGIINIPILIVDKELRIRRFTGPSQVLFVLSQGDIGLSLDDLRGPFSFPRLAELARTVMETHRAQQADMQSQSGQWYSVAVRPYKTLDDRTDGALISFINVDALKRSVESAELARDYAEKLLDTVREPLLVLEADLKVRHATQAFYETFQVSREETEGSYFYDLGSGQWNSARLRELLDEALFRDIPFHDFELTHNFSNIGTRTLRLNGRRVPPRQNEPVLLLLSIEDITERKEIDEIRYTRLFEAAKDGILIVDAGSGIVTDANPHFSELTGYPRERLIGRAVNDVFRESSAKNILDDVLQHEVARCENVAFSTSTGREIVLEIVANLYSVGSFKVIQCNVRDVTERMGVEKALRESERRFRLFVESVQDYAIFQMDTQGIVVTWNPGAQRVLGYREEEVLGRPATILFTPDDIVKGEVEKELETALRAGRAEDERWHLRKDGTRFWSSGVMTAVRDDSGQVRGLAKIMRDVTERKANEEQLQAAVLEKDALLKEIHHRVKNNLQVITSLLNLQSSHIDDPRARESLEQTGNRVRAIATIHDLLYKSGSLAHVDMDKQLNKLASDLLGLYGVSTDNVRVKVQVDDIKLDIEQAIPVTLVVNELLSNALKYAFPRQRTGEVLIHLERKNQGGYRLVVQDNGVGFPANINFRDTQSLGLQLIVIFVEQLQGSIDLIPGRGTNFEIAFPDM